MHAKQPSIRAHAIILFSSLEKQKQKNIYVYTLYYYDGFALNNVTK